MGARPLKRAIQTEIEDSMAEALLSGEIKRDSEVSVSLKDNKIVYSSKLLGQSKEQGKKKKTSSKTASKTGTGRKKVTKKSTSKATEKKIAEVTEN